MTPDSIREMAIKMKVDIIIPTYKPDDTFCLLLQKLREQTFVVHRLIIMNTEAALWENAKQKYPIDARLADLPCEFEIHHVSREEFDHGKTRYQGAQFSQADVVLFMTQDAVPADANLIAQLTRSLDSTEDGDAQWQSPTRDSFRERTVMLWNATRGHLITRMKAAKRQRQILIPSVLRHFSARMCARRTAGIYLKN